MKYRAQYYESDLCNYVIYLPRFGDAFGPRENCPRPRYVDLKIAGIYSRITIVGGEGASRGKGEDGCFDRHGDSDTRARAHTHAYLAGKIVLSVGHSRDYALLLCIFY